MSLREYEMKTLAFEEPWLLATAALVIAQIRPSTAFAACAGRIVHQHGDALASTANAAAFAFRDWCTCGFCRKSAATMGQPAMPIRREAGGPGRSHSASFDHRRRPETLRTAMATAFFCPTSTTSRLPRVTPV